MKVRPEPAIVRVYLSWLSMCCQPNSDITEPWKPYATREFPNLATPPQIQPTNNTNGNIHAFVSQSMLRPFAHALTFSEPKQAVWKPSAITLVGSHRITGTHGMVSPCGSLQVGFASPYTGDSFCTAADCPLSSYTHYKGFYLHEMTLGFVVNFYKDF